MKNIINNEGKKITVNENVYSALLIQKEKGLWGAIVKDTLGNTHMIPVQEII